MNTSNIVQKLWNYCNVLRDDGMSYGDYPSASLRAGSEQPALTPALDSIHGCSPRGRGGFTCDDELFDHYRHTLEPVGIQKGLL